MNCKTFRKYVGAFADGELEVVQNLEALEHLNMCPTCAARVANITDLKEALNRTYRDIAIPIGLEARLRETIAAQARKTSLGKKPTFTIPQQWFSLVRRNLWVPIGMAAAVLFTIGSWWYWPANTPRQGVITVVTGRTVADVREQHRRCLLGRGLFHHAPGLPHTLDGIREALSKELKLRVLAPNLSAYGFQLIGADRCGILGRPGAHIMYYSPSSRTALSLFSVGHVDFLTSSVDDHGGRQPYFVSTKDHLSVLAWHDGNQTYVFCGETPTDTLRSIFGDIHPAMSHPTRP